jgi:hypothetical protein
MSSKLQSTDDLEVQEVSDGQIRRGRLSHVLDKSTNTLKIKLPDGEEKTEESQENGALHGRVESIEFSGGQWKRTLAGHLATPEQNRLLEGPPIADMTFPTAIKVGDSWTESGPELRRWLGTDVLTVRGELKNTLLAVELQQGEKVAVIESVGEIGATMLDANNQEMQMTLGLQGKTRRSLDRGLDLEGSAAGAIKLAGDLVEGGTKMSLAVTGHYSARYSESLR